MNAPAPQMDLLWGAEQIAAVIGRTTRATYFLLENGEIPARKVYGRWVADRATLHRFFTNEIGPAAAATAPDRGSN
ncbi:MerR family transcriptional regulator [Rhizobium ruizarguesonis]|uniref:DNA-binding protein n=1 Tax=Rhizobium ruizarguesonis TaxID=2081791 RepID=UPI00102FE691|nr:DNA-binding protein [Rhizobium ruizarguesonis]TBC78010.1 DNA-binding protein [Rhizobium ruizarguesonis]